MVKNNNILEYLIKGIVVFLLCLPGVLVAGLIGVFGGIFSVVGLLLSFVITGYMFTMYWKK